MPASANPTAVEAEDPSARRGSGGPTWAVILVAFLTIVLDGFDTASLGIAVPSMARDWNTSPAAFTAPLMATNLGVVVGYIACGRLARRHGLRTVLLSGVVLFAVGSAASGLSGGIALLTAARAVTGLGLGAVLPAAISIATSQLQAAARQRAAIAVTMGLSVGSLAAGLSGTALVVGLGWQSVFWAGAILPAALLPALGLVLPEGRTPGRDRKGNRSDLAALFAPGHRTGTIMLWAFAFLIFLTFYAFASWLPTLLTSYGFTPALAPLGAASLGIGGILGACVLIAVTGRFSTGRVLAAAGVVSLVFLILAAVIRPDQTGLLLLFAGVGGGLATGMVGQAAMAVATYSEEHRTSGVGWAAALGRVGSVAGPAAGGALLAAGVPSQSVVLLACLPVGLAVLVIWALTQRKHPSDASPDQTSRLEA